MASRRPRPAQPASPMANSRVQQRDPLQDQQDEERNHGNAPRMKGRGQGGHVTEDTVFDHAFTVIELFVVALRFSRGGRPSAVRMRTLPAPSPWSARTASVCGRRPGRGQCAG